MASSALGQRITTALVLGGLILAAMFLSPPRIWAMVMLVVALAAAYEWSKLVGLERSRRLAFTGVVLGVCALLLFMDGAGFARGWPDHVVFVVCGTATLFWLAIAPAWLRADWPTGPRPYMAAAGGVVLIGAWVALVELQARSPWLVLAAMAVVWIADTAAYFTGRKFGRRKLAPTISPGKSWEGVAGGLVAVGVYALLLVGFASNAGYDGPRGPVAVAGFVLLLVSLGAISMVGDLYESLLKRHAGVKDSGSLLPGHGGVLDRIDALVAAMPPAVLAVALFLPKAAGG